jgi:hypothetical protein
MTDQNKINDYAYGVVPPGRYAQGQRSPIVWVLLCASCAGFAPTTTEDYHGFLSGRCEGCGTKSRELHRFRAWIDTAPGCRCTGGHERIHGDVHAAATIAREPTRTGGTDGD